LFLADARPIKEEWNIRPYLGVFPLVFNALNKAQKKEYQSVAMTKNIRVLQ